MKEKFDWSQKLTKRERTISLVSIAFGLIAATGIFVLAFILVPVF